MTQQMFKYDQNTYRFISDEPMKVGDSVYIINNPKECVVKKVILTKIDKGNWRKDGVNIVIYSNKVIV